MQGKEERERAAEEIGQESQTGQSMTEEGVTCNKKNGGDNGTSIKRRKKTNRLVTPRRNLKMESAARATVRRPSYGIKRDRGRQNVTTGC